MTQLRCPYCGSAAAKRVTGNDGELFVGEDSEVFDADISRFECSANPKRHIFYADDFNGNNNQTRMK